MSNTDASCEREGNFDHVACGGFIETCVCQLSPLKSRHFSTFFFLYMQTTPNASGWYDGTCYHHAGTRRNEVLMLIQPNSSIKAKCKDD